MPLDVEARDVEAGDVVLVLVTLTHPGLAAPLRACANGADVTSRGNVFTGSAFELRFPSAGERADWQAELRIDNIDSAIMAAVRGSKERATVLIEVVMSDAPDTVEVALADFVVRQVEADASAITAFLSPPVFETEPAVYQRFTPRIVPGLF